MVSLRRLSLLRSLRITADKRLRFTSPKVPSATSFIHNPLGEMHIFKEQKGVDDEI